MIFKYYMLCWNRRTRNSSHMKRNVFSESAFFSVFNSLLSLLPAGLVVEQVVINPDRVVVAVRAESMP